MLDARGQSTAVLQQQHVHRLPRHTIDTTSAGMAHANGPTARCHSLPDLLFFRSYNEVFVQTAFIPYYLSTDIDFVCVLCISSSTAARRQTAPPHYTHNFCWHGPCQRSHDEMPFLYLPFNFFAATTKCLYKRHLFPTTSAHIYRLRMCTMYQ